MQTFLPSEAFDESARALDRQRLGKQRIEARTILTILANDGPKKGWYFHPAVRMWRGHEAWLASYGREICTEWRSRGYQDAQLEYFQEAMRRFPWSPYPSWLGDERFHLSHRSNLLRKKPEHYRVLWPNDPDDLPYIWPEGLL